MLKDNQNENVKAKNREADVCSLERGKIPSDQKSLDCNGATAAPADDDSNSENLLRTYKIKHACNGRNEKLKHHHIKTTTNCSVLSVCAKDVADCPIAHIPQG